MDYTAAFWSHFSLKHRLMVWVKGISSSDWLFANIRALFLAWKRLWLSQRKLKIGSLLLFILSLWIAIFEIDVHSWLVKIKSLWNVFSYLNNVCSSASFTKNIRLVEVRKEFSFYRHHQAAVALYSFMKKFFLFLFLKKFLEIKEHLLLKRGELVIHDLLKMLYQPSFKVEHLLLEISTLLLWRLYIVELVIGLQINFIINLRTRILSMFLESMVTLDASWVHISLKLLLHHWWALVDKWLAKNVGLSVRKVLRSQLSLVGMVKIRVQALVWEVQRIFHFILRYLAWKGNIRAAFLFLGGSLIWVSQRNIGLFKSVWLAYLNFRSHWVD